VTTSEPGGIDAKGADFLLDALDHFFPLPTRCSGPSCRRSDRNQRHEARPPAPSLLNVPVDLVHQLDDTLGTLLRSNDTVPLSIVVALFLNFLATMVQSSSLVGPFPASPFANLSSAKKAEAFRTLEQDTASVVARVDTNLSEPARQTLSGVLAFLAGALSSSPLSARTPNGARSIRHPGRQRRPGGLAPLRLSVRDRLCPVNGWDEFPRLLREPHTSERLTCATSS